MSLGGSEPFPRPPRYYDLQWAARLIQRLDQFMVARQKGDRIVLGRLINRSGRVGRVTLVDVSSYAAKLTDHMIDVNVAAVVDVTLPANPELGQIVEIEDGSGAASSNPISIYPPAGLNLNGVTTAFMLSTDYGRVKAVYNGTEYVAA